MSKITIYTLSCPMTGEIKYVGQTMYSLPQRLSGYIASPTNQLMAQWLRTLDGSLPIIEELDVVDIELAEECEKYWIIQLKAWGCPLLNVATPSKNRRGVKNRIWEKPVVVVDDWAIERSETISDLISAFTELDETRIKLGILHYQCTCLMDYLIGEFKLGSEDDGIGRFSHDDNYFEFGIEKSVEEREYVYLRVVSLQNILTQ